MVNQAKYGLNVTHTAMAIDTYYGDYLGSMITHKIIKENVTYSDQWRAFIKFNS